MLVQERRRIVAFNWVAFWSYAGSLAVGLAIWVEVIRLVQRLVE